MTTAASPALPTARRISVDAAGIPLSALLSVPARTPPRATVVALHGAGMTAGYFDAAAVPGSSLLRLGAQHGLAVLAVDRPGYGGSATRLPAGLGVVDQAEVLAAGLRAHAARHHTGAGMFLVAHSFGGKVALAMAAGGGVPGLLGLDISGCGHRYADGGPPAVRGRRRWTGNWGPLRLYPPGALRRSAAVVAPVPAAEERDLERWPRLFAELAHRVAHPVRFTFAEHERWWRHGRDDLADLRSRLVSAPRVLTEDLPGTGHNISLGRLARTYHLRVLEFLAESIAAAEGSNA